MAKIAADKRGKRVTLFGHVFACIVIPSASHRGAKVGICESALGSAPEGAPRNRGAPGGAPESAQGD